MVEINKQARLSQHFTLGELCKTSVKTADGNIPSHVHIENLKRLCGWLEMLRDEYNRRYPLMSNEQLVMSNCDCQTSKDSAPLSNHNSQFSYPYTYLYNISNRLSQQFYGAKDLSAYELKGGDGPIMQCRHCIRYALGYCVKHGGQRPLWHEPLSLVLGDGRRFRLEFDCKHCQMNVYAACGLNDK